MLSCTTQKNIKYHLAFAPYQKKKKKSCFGSFFFLSCDLRVCESVSVIERFTRKKVSWFNGLVRLTDKNSVKMQLHCATPPNVRTYLKLAAFSTQYVSLSVYGRFFIFLSLFFLQIKFESMSSYIRSVKIIICIYF